MWGLFHRFLVVSAIIWTGIAVLMALLFWSTNAHSQTERDWERSRVQIGPGKAYGLLGADPVIVFSGNVRFYLWGVEPRPGFHRELNSILQTAYATCVLTGGSSGAQELLNVACKTDHVPDIATELIARHVAVIDTRSGRRQKQKTP